jgi:DNA adenine methylase
LGGGSVLLALLSMQKQGKIKIHGTVYAYDINKPLIHVYRHIQSNKEELYGYINKYVSEYENITGEEVNRKAKNIEEAKTSKESYYYWIRSKYNSMEKNTVECSALFIFMNKTCFRGVYREGPNGYNVPFGHYKKTPTIITKETLDAVSELIKDVIFIDSDFIKSMKNIETGDFVYLDPPYAPEKSDSFVNYVADGFDLKKHRKLFNEVKKLDFKNVSFLMSNANVEMVQTSMKKFKIDEITARRAIHSKNPGAKAKEVLIYNK